MNSIFKKIEEQEKESKDFGFYWENIDQLLEQILSECAEIKDAWLKGDRHHLKEEIGDLLNAAVSLAIFCEFDAKETLRQSSDKYERRFRRLIELVKQDGLPDLRGKPIEELLNYWKLAKFEPRNREPNDLV
jgi:uncharacterized protein YabN with tetrapyrrole methylase and pyrophosphatase domain